MPITLYLLLAFIQVAAILLAPKPWLRFVGLFAALMVLCGILWTWSFANTCSSDGCIGIFILGLITAAVAGSALVAGLIRWMILRGNQTRSDKEVD